jgi:Ca2+-binding EF-hand superfamily protein
MDSFDGNRKVTSSEFMVALNEIGCKVSKAESDVSCVLLPIFQALLKLLDTDGDGNVNFDEFLIAVRVSSFKLGVTRSRHVVHVTPSLLG